MPTVIERYKESEKNKKNAYFCSKWMRRDLSLGEFFLNTQINPNSNIISLQHSCDIQVISWLQLARAPANRMYLRLILGGEVRKVEVVGSVRNSPWRKGLVGEHSGNCSFLSVGWGVAAWPRCTAERSRGEESSWPRSLSQESVSVSLTSSTTLKGCQKTQ